MEYSGEGSCCQGRIIVLNCNVASLLSRFGYDLMRKSLPRDVRSGSLGWELPGKTATSDSDYLSSTMHFTLLGSHN